MKLEKEMKIKAHKVFTELLDQYPAESDKDEKMDLITEYLFECCILYLYRAGNDPREMIKRVIEVTDTIDTVELKT
jgi:hypothetical protein